LQNQKDGLEVHGIRGEIFIFKWRLAMEKRVRIKFREKKGEKSSSTSEGEEIGIWTIRGK